MKKEVKLLLSSGIDSLLLSIEHFNRPSDRGRTTAVLMFLNHSFEMLLKAVILYRGGKIREKRAKETMGFDHCVRKCISDSQVKCLTNEQALTTGEGLNVSLRIDKKEGIPIKLVKEGEGLPVAIKRVNELDYYSLGCLDLAEKLGLGVNKTVALIRHFNLQENEEYFKGIKIGSATFKRYSPKALDYLKKELTKANINEIWENYKNRTYKKKTLG